MVLTHTHTHVHAQIRTFTQIVLLTLPNLQEEADSDLKQEVVGQSKAGSVLFIHFREYSSNTI